MISFFRRALASWIVVGLLGLIMLAFIITGVHSPTGLGSLADNGDILARVGDETVTGSELSDQLNRQVSRIRQEQPQSEVDMAAYVREGAFEQNLGEMVRAKALAAFGHKQGMRVSKRLVDGEIASIPAFRNLAGEFDQTTFRRTLAAERITEDALRSDIAAQIIQRQLLVPVAASAKLPATMARYYAGLRLETRSGAVGLVPSAAMTPGNEPTDAEISAHFKGHQDRFTIPERRVLRYAAFGRADVAATAKASDAEIAAAYRAAAANYGPKETRSFSQVVLPSEAAAKAFAAKLASGTSFAQAAAQGGFAPGDIAIGAQSKADLARLIGPAVADAAFAAGKGQTTAPIRSPLGWHILRVEGITTTPARPLEAVRAEIAARIEQQKADDALNALVSAIEDAIGDGASFAEVARAHKLQVQETAPITATGAAPGVADFKLPPDVAPLLKPGFEMSTDEDPVVETVTPNQRFALLAVSRVEPAAPPPLAEIRDVVKADLVRERARARAQALASSIVAKANAGIPLEQAFASAGVRLPPVQRVNVRRMDLEQMGERVPPPLAMIFALPKGKTRLLAAPNGNGWFVVHVEQVVPGDLSKAPGLLEQTRSQLSQGVSDEYGAQFARAVEQSLDIERNQVATARVKRQLQGGGAAE
jgi:peptidyl-prolyl cis-trans isomerase D